LELGILLSDTQQRIEGEYMSDEMFFELMKRFKSSDFEVHRIFFNLWSDCNEQASFDFNFPIMSSEIVSVFMQVVDQGGFFYFVSDVGVESEPFIIKYNIEKSVDSFMRFQKSDFNQTGLLTTFYIFDDSLEWYVLIDESVLFVMNERFSNKFVEKFGGSQVILERMQAEIKTTSGYAYRWRSEIISDFKRKT